LQCEIVSCGVKQRIPYPIKEAINVEHISQGVFSRISQARKARPGAKAHTHDVESHCVAYSQDRGAVALICAQKTPPKSVTRQGSPRPLNLSSWKNACFDMKPRGLQDITRFNRSMRHSNDKAFECFNPTHTLPSAKPRLFLCTSPLPVSTFFQPSQVGGDGIPTPTLHQQHTL